MTYLLSCLGFLARASSNFGSGFNTYTAEQRTREQKYEAIPLKVGYFSNDLKRKLIWYKGWSDLSMCALISSTTSPLTHLLTIIKHAVIHDDTVFYIILTYFQPKICKGWVFQVVRWEKWNPMIQLTSKLQRTSSALQTVNSYPSLLQGRAEWVETADVVGRKKNNGDVWSKFDIVFFLKRILTNEKEQDKNCRSTPIVLRNTQEPLLSFSDTLHPKTRKVRQVFILSLNFKQLEKGRLPSMILSPGCGCKTFVWLFAL